MKKKVLCLAMATVLSLGISVCSFASDAKATPNNSSVAVNGSAIDIGAYNIGGYNYFKLRDVAAALNGTGSNFEVGYDAEAKCISLTTDKAYTVAGGELGAKPTAEKTAEVSSQKIMLNGKDVTMQAYVIDGYNYFQLRELGTNLGFEVTWDDTAKAINMVTKGAPAEVEKPVEEPAKELTDVEKLQEAINNTAEDGTVNVTGTFTGKPGDKIVVDKPMTIIGDAVLKSITLEIDADYTVWVEGITFEGIKTTDHALVIKNAGGRSAIKGCIFNNFKSDALIVENMEEDSILGIVYNTFNEYGLDEKKIDAAILFGADKAQKFSAEIIGNNFNLTKDIDDEKTMDVALATNTTIPTETAVEVFKDVKVLFADNKIAKGSSKSSVDAYIDFAEGNFETH